MTQTPSTDMTAVHASEDTRGRFSGTLDWIVAALLVLAGLVFAAAGTLSYTALDRAWVAGLVADGRLQSLTMTDAELIDVTYGLVWWGGIGLLVTGVLLAVGGLVFLAARVRRETSVGMARGTTSSAIVGAAATVVLAFVPFSPILGGGVAGYLARHSPDFDGFDGARVGAYAGLLAAVPLALVLGFLVAGVATSGYAGIAAIMALSLAGAVAYTVGLGAAGGYLGVALTGDSTDHSA